MHMGVVEGYLHPCVLQLCSCGHRHLQRLPTWSRGHPSAGSLRDSDVSQTERLRSGGRQAFWQTHKTNGIV